ncbi:hypothetical protein [Sphingobacterium kyonggiense]
MTETLTQLNIPALQRNRMYKLSELNIGDRFMKSKRVYEVTEKKDKVFVAEAKVIDGKVGIVDKMEYSKQMKECLVKFLRHVK